MGLRVLGYRRGVTGLDVALFFGALVLTALVFGIIVLSSGVETVKTIKVEPDHEHQSTRLMDHIGNITRGLEDENESEGSLLSFIEYIVETYRRIVGFYGE